MKASLKTFLLERSRQHEGVITYTHLEEWALDARRISGKGYRAETAARKMRDLAIEGEVERLAGKYATWKYIGKKKVNLKTTMTSQEFTRQLNKEREFERTGQYQLI